MAQEEIYWDLDHTEERGDFWLVFNAERREWQAWNGVFTLAKHITKSMVAALSEEDRAFALAHAAALADAIAIQEDER